MPPVWNQRASLAEHEVPVDVARLELRHRVWPRSEQPRAARARRSPRSVKLRPLRTVRPRRRPTRTRLVHAALVDEVLHQAAHRVVDQRRHHRRVQPKQRLRPRATLYLPPPSHTWNARVCTRPRPAEAQHHSPRLTWSQRQADLSLMARGMGRQVYCGTPGLLNAAGGSLTSPARFPRIRSASTRAVAVWPADRADARASGREVARSAQAAAFTRPPPRAEADSSAQRGGARGA